jgi:hypothetical protein
MWVLDQSTRRSEIKHYKSIALGNSPDQIKFTCGVIKAVVSVLTQIEIQPLRPTASWRWLGTCRRRRHDVH